MNEVSDGISLPVDGNLFSVSDLRDESGDHLVRVLVLSKYVVSSSDHNGELEGVAVCSYHELSSSLCCSVWIGRV